MSVPAVEDEDSVRGTDRSECVVKEEFVEEEQEHSWGRSPRLNSDPQEAWKEWKTSAPHAQTKDQHFFEDTSEPPLLVLNTEEEEEDIKPPPQSLFLHNDVFKPHSAEAPADVVADEDVKPSALELMSFREQALMWQEEEVVKPCPLDLLQIQVHPPQTEGQLESPVNFWTSVKEEEVGGSDVEADSPASRVVVISDDDSECEPDRKSKRERSSESASDEESDLKLEEGGRATKRSFQPLVRTQERPPKARKLHAGDSPTSHWRTHEEDDIEPAPLEFTPSRQPGPQPSSSRAKTPLDFFRLFFTDIVIITLLENTNAYGAHNTPQGDKWRFFSFHDMFSFLSIVIFMGLLKLPQLVDYWKTTRPYNIPFPQSVMTGAKFLNMCRSLQMCCQEKDATNQAKGSQAYDRQGKIKPLFNQIVDACRTHFHPSQNLSIKEQMVAPNEGLSGHHLMRNKCTTENKLMLLTDAATGYTWNFTVSEGLKNHCHSGSGKGGAYDTVMTLVDVETLGTGYHLYFDSSYTSPRLLRDLWRRKIGACGSLSANKMENLKTKLNDYPPDAPEGSVRWFRDGELLFVKWRDAREVALCSTIHKAYGGEVIQRRLKREGRLVYEEIPIPPAVSAYTRLMEDPSADGHVAFPTVLLKTKKWYRQFFYHFVDVAVVNAHILYGQCHRGPPLSQREFRDALVQQLADAGAAAASTTAPRHLNIHKSHKAVFLYKGQSFPTDFEAPFGRKRCVICHKKTAVGCESCQVSLCFLSQRNCYSLWHAQHAK